MTDRRERSAGEKRMIVAWLLAVVAYGVLLGSTLLDEGAPATVLLFLASAIMLASAWIGGTEP